MNWVITAEDIQEQHRRLVGGKGYSLALLARNGFEIPQTVCVTGDAYHEFVLRTGLRERIQLELHRKDLSQMRWEEIWDCATRIRNMFLRKKMPADLHGSLLSAVRARFGDRAVAVRSSALEEDTAGASFAGLHDSYINVTGADAILEHIRMVWASLWSDAALLYRQEIGLHAEKSAMAVVIQSIVAGDRSGVAFTRSPNNAGQGIVESVHGLNQGLVDGQVEPDRWILDRNTRRVVSHLPAARHMWVVPAEHGVRLSPLPADKTSEPPLSEEQTREVFGEAWRSEQFFGSPQDVEWTYQDHSLVILQSRPITAVSKGDSGDKREWYRSLHRSFDNLRKLRDRIEDKLIPGMIAAAEALAGVDLRLLLEAELADEIRRRWELNQKWVNVYWEEFIPFAHGVRLFGQVYNDAVRPEDPYEFVDLLTQTEMASLERNRMLEELAAVIRDDEALAARLEKGFSPEADPDFFSRIETFVQTYGDLTCAVTGGSRCSLDTEPLIGILLEMASHPPASGAARRPGDAGGLKQKFMSCFEGDRLEEAVEMLDLARSSYRLRDDDNIHLGRIEAQLLAAVREGRQRIESRKFHGSDPAGIDALEAILAKLDHRLEAMTPYRSEPGQAFEVKPRQLIGQPGGPGIATGTARVVRQHTDLAGFRHGEVLVCDAVDPNMTFVVPLASAVVERRGGMLIHGAIIAREYGLPCVTGVPDATAVIRTGDSVTVDGYLGIVTLGSGEL